MAKKAQSIFSVSGNRTETKKTANGTIKKKPAVFKSALGKETSTTNHLLKSSISQKQLFKSSFHNGSVNG